MRPLAAAAASGVINHAGRENFVEIAALTKVIGCGMSMNVIGATVTHTPDYHAGIFFSSTPPFLGFLMTVVTQVGDRELVGFVDMDSLRD